MPAPARGFPVSSVTLPSITEPFSYIATDSRNRRIPIIIRKAYFRFIIFNY